MKKVHDNVHKRYSDKTMLTIKTNLLKKLNQTSTIQQKNVYAYWRYIGVKHGIHYFWGCSPIFYWEGVTYEDNA